MCIMEFCRSETNGQTLIIVPTISLQDQWYVALQEELGVRSNQIGLLNGQEQPVGEETIIIAVINSARRFTSSFSRGRRVFLIVDECHRAGSPINALALQGEFVATLGLSATPEREYDEGFDAHISPQLGSIIYDYTYADAARDHVISSFSLTNVRVSMLPDEEATYRKLSQRIAQSMRSNQTAEVKERTKRLLQRRASVAALATMRIPVAVRLVEAHRGERIVIFHERIKAADQIVGILRHRGHRVTIYHSEIGPDVRRDNLRLFRTGQFDVLVCCRALDEGLNVPEASVAVIASSTASQRQRIQRLGRILRKVDGKEEAVVYTLFATNEERKRLEFEESNLQSITNVRWMQGEAKTGA